MSPARLKCNPLPANTVRSNHADLSLQNEFVLFVQTVPCEKRVLRRGIIIRKFPFELCFIRQCMDSQNARRRSSDDCCGAILTAVLSAHHSNNRKHNLRSYCHQGLQIVQLKYCHDRLTSSRINTVLSLF